MEKIKVVKSKINKQRLSTKKTNVIEKGFRKEIVKATDAYLKVELERYKHLTLIVEGAKV